MFAASWAVGAPHAASRNVIPVYGADPSLLSEIQNELRETGFEVAAAADEGPVAAGAITIFAGSAGHELLPVVDCQIAIVLDPEANADRAVEAMRAGASDYLAWPGASGRLRDSVLRALRQLEASGTRETVRAGLSRWPGFDHLLGRNPSLLTALDTAARIAASDCPILLCGEPGTGKELLARAIHQNSARSARSFVALEEGASIPEILQQEDAGSIFLPEAGSLSLGAQAAVLSMLDSLQVRVLAATAVNLSQLVERGLFRRDLYFRLSAVQLQLPPLRERLSDLPELVEDFLTQQAAGPDGATKTADPELLQRLRAWHWPGNLDELNALLGRLVALSGDSGRLSPADLPEQMSRRDSVLGTLRLELPAEGISLEAVERELLCLALRRFKGNQTHAARYLGLTRKTLIYRMEKFGLREAEMVRAIA